MISPELNATVVDLLQHLLFWQERQKALNPVAASGKKRLVHAHSYIYIYMREHVK